MVNHTYVIMYQLFKHISHCSGVILKVASAHGPFAQVCLAMTMTHVHVGTSVTVASAQAHVLAATQCVSTVMAATVVQKQDLDL